MLTSCSLVSCLPFLAVFLPTLSPSFFYSGLDRQGCQPPTLSNIENWYDQGFRYFARSQSHKIQVNPRNPAKFTKTCKIPRNRSNRCLYNIFETYLSYLGYIFTCCKLANLPWNFITETCKQRPETTRCRLCCEKLGTSHDVKGLAIGSFLERIVVERANDNLC